MAKDSDKTRTNDTRLMDERDYEMRAIMDMHYQDPLYVDPKVIPPGMEYYWVRESTLGQGDTSRMVEMKRKGWKPVPADRHPEMVFDDFFGRLEHVKGYIYQKGLILCERRKELGDAERKQIDLKNYQIMSSMPGTENFMSEPSIPTQFQGDTYMTKNTTFGS